LPRDWERKPAQDAAWRARAPVMDDFSDGRKA
jgi:hypothetical protein